MKIAQVAPPWLPIPPTGYGGVESIVSLLTDGLVERGHDVTLFATGDSSTSAKLVSAFERAPGNDAINSMWHDSVHSMMALRDPDGFDVVHVHTPWSALASAMAARRPVVHTLHGTLSPEMATLYGRYADRAWFVAISEAQQRTLAGLRYAGVVHNGIDLDAYPLVERKEDFVLFLGRSAPEKGLLRAIGAAREAGVPLVAALKIAQPHEVAHWEREVAPALGDDVTVLGELRHEEKVSLLGRARAVLFPIDWDEPFGLVMAEAMACGTPVVGTPRGAAPEVIAHGETGWIVPVERYADQAAAVLATTDDIDPDACRRRVEKLFSKESMVDAYEAVLERVASAGT